MPKKWLGLYVWVGLCLFSGYIGSLFEPGEWYQSLNKSSLTPPNLVFPIVWNILFVLMGAAAWLVWRRAPEKGVILALIIFITQLGLNIFWSYLFFGIQRPDFALYEITVLWFLIFITLFTFFRIDGLAGMLLVPYLLWVSFAIYLNYSIYHLNNI